MKGGEGFDNLKELCSSLFSNRVFKDLIKNSKFLISFAMCEV